MGPTSRTSNNSNAPNPPLRRVPRRLPSSINPERGFNRGYTGSSGFSNSSDFSNRGGFPGGFGNFGGRDGSASHGHPTTFTHPAPLTARSLSTHLNQMQTQETPRVKSPQQVPFDTAYVQQAFNQSRSRSASNANSDVQSATARRLSGSGIMGMNPGPPTASSGGTGRRSYGQFINQGNSTSIEALLSKPPGGNLMEASKDLRFLILRDGIPTDADGHVCSPFFESRGPVRHEGERLFLTFLPLG